MKAWMRMWMRLAGMALLAVALGACNVVTTPQPFGDGMVQLEPADWEGTWVASDSADTHVVTVKVQNAAAGILVGARVEFKDNPTTAAVAAVQFHVREVAGRLFISMPADPEDPSKGYLWGMLKTSKDQAILWVPSPKAFARYVKEGRLPGNVDGDNAHLTALSPEQQQLIAEKDAKELFDWSDPLVFRRVAPLKN